MPEKRLARARASLAEGYRFGDAAHKHRWEMRTYRATLPSGEVLFDIKECAECGEMGFLGNEVEAWQN